jgi:putative ABC transport system permease protein
MIWRSFYLMKGSPDSELRIVTRHRVSLTFYIPAAYRDKIRTVAGVVNVTPWRWFRGIYKDDKPENSFAQFGTDPTEVFKVFKDFQIDAGQLAAFQRDRAGAAVVRQLAEQHGWKLGDRLVLKGTYYPVILELTIRAIFDAPDTWKTLLFNFGYIEEARSAFKGKIGTFVSLVESADAVGPVSKQIDSMFQNTGRPTRTESEKAFGLTFISLLGNVKAFILSIALAVSFALLLVVGNTMAMIARERIREIAVMKTLGFSKGSILTMLVGEAVEISFGGGAGSDSRNRSSETDIAKSFR